MPRTLREAAAAFPFRLTHVPTDNGSCFTPAFARVCHELGAEYRHTKPYSPHTNGMVERFNGRVGGEVLGITVYSHAQLERLLRGFNAAYNARASACSTGRRPTKSSPSASRRAASSPTRSRMAVQDPRTSPKHASSLKPPRRSRNQTAKAC